MMKIFQVFNSRIQKHGSFEDLFIELSRSSSKKGIKVCFIFPDIKTEGVKEEILSYPNTEVFVIEKIWSSIAYSINFLKLVFRKNPDILDFHFCYSINFAPLFLLLRLLGKKVIYHYHGEIKPINELRFINRHFSKLRLMTLFVNKIICVSEANKQYLEALNIRKEMVVVYNGIEVSRLQNINVKTGFKEQTWTRNGQLIVTTIGSLIPRKGIDIFIGAASIVSREIPQAKFVIVGGGEDKEYRKQAEALGLKEKVIFTGLIKEYPYHILKDTDVYVSASYAESFGLSIAEAQAIGKPVVATRVGGVPEVVVDGRTGKLVPPGDSRGLAESIIYFLKNENIRKEFGNNGKVWVSEHFNLKDKVEELLNVCFN